MSIFSQINQNNIKTVYNHSLVTLSIKKDQALVGLNHLWQGTMRVCAEQKTNISIKATQSWNATCVASERVIKEISLLPGKMQANENVALTVIVTCNALFFFIINKTVGALNNQIDKIIKLQPGKVKNLKDLILNDGVFAAALFALNGLAIPKVLGYSMGKWAVIVPVVCTLVRHFWKKSNDKIQKLEQKLEQQYIIMQSLDNNALVAFGKIENQSNQTRLAVIGNSQSINEINHQSNQMMGFVQANTTSINDITESTIKNTTAIKEIRTTIGKNSEIIKKFKDENDLVSSGKSSYKSKNKKNNTNNGVGTPTPYKKKK